MNKKIQNLITKTSQGLIEREEIVRLTYLALLGGESIFLLGPPGVAKSLLARRMKDVLEGGSEFEYLMNKFSTPEEIFGPISLSKLDEDKYERNINGYLPTSDIVFLDEIWKASPSIQNTLLTVINEKLFRNGDSDVEVPLKLLLAASNELPAEGEGLEALYDRFLIRMYVNNTKTDEGFNQLITSAGMDDYKIGDKEKISIKELEKIRKESKTVDVPMNILNFINSFRKRLDVELGEHAPYISDRRWKKIVGLLKTSAYVSGRKEISPSDILLIKEMIWETEKQIPLIEQVFKDEFHDLIISFDKSSLTKIERSLDKVDELVRTGYINSSKIETTKRTLRQGGGYNRTEQKLVVFNGSYGTNKRYFFIPEDRYEEIKNNEDSRSVWFIGVSETLNGNLNDTQVQNSHFTYNSSKDEIAYSNQWKLTPKFKTTKMVDKHKLNSAKDLLDGMIIDITNIKKDVESKVEKIRSEDSTLIYGHEFSIDVASMEINKKLRTYVGQHGTLLGKIVPHIGSFSHSRKYDSNVNYKEYQELGATTNSATNKSPTTKPAPKKAAAKPPAHNCHTVTLY